jgi:hypothetical protein
MACFCFRTGGLRRGVNGPSTFGILPAHLIPWKDFGLSVYTSIPFSFHLLWKPRQHK